MSIFRKRSAVPYPFDADKETPVLRVSICTGETAFGFRSKETGHFREAVLIQEERQLEKLKRAYGVNDFEKTY